MWKFIKNFFLDRFRQRSKAERQKAFYLLLSTLTMLSFEIFSAASHLFFLPGVLYHIGDVVGLSGCLLALYFFRQGELERAGKTLVAIFILVVIIQVILSDLSRTDPAIRYRVYMTFTSILATFFIFISFFRNVRQLVYFMVIFIAMLTLHFCIILHQIGDLPEYSFLAMQHYLVCCAGVVVVTIMCGLLITMIEKLYTQAIDQGEIIKRQNVELKNTIVEQADFLVSSNESLKEFAYLTSHDLREPLRSISGFIALIKKQADNNTIASNKEEVNEYFRYVQRGVLQMEELIKDIKEYAHINILEKNFIPLSLSEICYQVRDTLEDECHQVGGEIVIPSTLPVVNVDKVLIISLIQNLFSNAIKYHRKDIPPVVKVSSKDVGDEYVITVADNGMGIAEEYQDQIFLAFKRLQGKKDGGTGTGLGLAISKKIIEIHKGKIWVESTLGEGSTFYFTLKKLKSSDTPQAT